MFRLELTRYNIHAIADYSRSHKQSVQKPQPEEYLTITTGQKVGDVQQKVDCTFIKHRGNGKNLGNRVQTDSENETASKTAKFLPAFNKEKLD